MEEPVRSTASRSPRGAGGIGDDRASRPQRDAALELLDRELQHRIRNLLSVVQCFVTSTEASTADDYRAALMERLTALSDAFGFIEGACVRASCHPGAVDRADAKAACHASERSRRPCRTGHHPRAAMRFIASSGLS